MGKLESFIEYYCKFKELMELHRSLGFGDSPRSNEGFTEGLCCEVYGLKKDYPEGREWDLISPDGIRYEIKGTVGKNNSTSINPENGFDFLIWVNVNFDNNEITFRHYRYKAVHSFLNSRNYKGKKPTISLNLIPKDQITVDKFFVDVEGNKLNKY